MTGDRGAQEEKREGARSRDGGVKRDRKGQGVIVAEINRDPRHERDPKEEVDVCPKHNGIDPGHEVNEMMMIDPVDSDDDEAQDIGKKGWPHFRQRSCCRIVRRLQLQNHDGNENSDNAITERFHPVRFHASECNIDAPGRKPATLDPEFGRGAGAGRDGDVVVKE